MEFFFKGILAGFIIAVPIGPVAVLCFRRVLTDRGLVGFVTVLGAATADALYGLLAAFGLTAITHLLLAHRTSLRIVGGLFIIYLGAAMLRARPPAAARDDAPRNLAGAYFSTFLLMLANPSIIVSFLAVFAAIDRGGEPPRLDAAWIGAGVFLGSAAWWVIFELIAVWLGDRVESRTLHLINLVAGGFICTLGVWQLLSSLIFRHAAPIP